jgi:hypothetical protein
MSFVQIVEMRTKEFEELSAIGEEFFQATEGKRTLRRSYLGRDRNDPERYFILAFFDSYESAMQNSNLPETADLAERQMRLLEGTPTFVDLDILEERP